MASGETNQSKGAAKHNYPLRSRQRIEQRTSPIMRPVVKRTKSIPYSSARVRAIETTSVLIKRNRDDSPIIRCSIKEIDRRHSERHIILERLIQMSLIPNKSTTWVGPPLTSVSPPASPKSTVSVSSASPPSSPEPIASVPSTPAPLSPKSIISVSSTTPLSSPIHVLSSPSPSKTSISEECASPNLSSSSRTQSPTVLIDWNTPIILLPLTEPVETLQPCSSVLPKTSVRSLSSIFAESSKPGGDCITPALAMPESLEMTLSAHSSTKFPTMHSDHLPLPESVPIASKANGNDTFLMQVVHAIADHATNKDSVKNTTAQQKMTCVKWVDLVRQFQEGKAFVWLLQQGGEDVALALTTKNIMPLVAKTVDMIDIRAMAAERLPLLATLLIDGTINEQTRNRAILMSSIANYWKMFGLVNGDGLKQTHPHVKPKYLNILDIFTFNTISSILINEVPLSVPSETATTATITTSKPSTRTNPATAPTAKTAASSTIPTISPTAPTTPIAPTKLPTWKTIATPEGEVTIIPTTRTIPVLTTTTLTSTVQSKQQSNLVIRLTDLPDQLNPIKTNVPTYATGKYRWLVLMMIPDFSHIFFLNVKCSLSYLKIQKMLEDARRANRELRFPLLSGACIYASPIDANTILLGPYKQGDYPSIAFHQNDVNEKVLSLGNLLKRDQSSDRTCGFWYYVMDKTHVPIITSEKDFIRISPANGHGLYGKHIIYPKCPQMTTVDTEPRPITVNPQKLATSLRDDKSVTASCQSAMTSESDATPIKIVYSCPPSVKTGRVTKTVQNRPSPSPNTASDSLNSSAVPKIIFSVDCSLPKNTKKSSIDNDIRPIVQLPTQNIASLSQRPLTVAAGLAYALTETTCAEQPIKIPPLPPSPKLKFSIINSKPISLRDQSKQGINSIGEKEPMMIAATGALAATKKPKTDEISLTAKGNGIPEMMIKGGYFVMKSNGTAVSNVKGLGWMEAFQQANGSILCSFSTPPIWVTITVNGNCPFIDSYLRTLVYAFEPSNLQIKWRFIPSCQSVLRAKKEQFPRCTVNLNTVITSDHVIDLRFPFQLDNNKATELLLLKLAYLCGVKKEDVQDMNKTAIFQKCAELMAKRIHDGCNLSSDILNIYNHLILRKVGDNTTPTVKMN